jgi:hypothetical protein
MCRYLLIGVIAAHATTNSTRPNDVPDTIRNSANGEPSR